MLKEKKNTLQKGSTDQLNLFDLQQKKNAKKFITKRFFYFINSQFVLNEPRDYPCRFFSYYKTTVFNKLFLILC